MNAIAVPVLVLGMFVIAGVVYAMIWGVGKLLEGAVWVVGFVLGGIAWVVLTLIGLCIRGVENWIQAVRIRRAIAARRRGE